MRSGHRWRNVALAILVAAAVLGIVPTPTAEGQTPVIAGTARPTTLPGIRPADIGAGGDELYAIDSANVYRWDGSAWQGIGMSGRGIDVGPIGPYIVTANNEVWYRPSAGSWQQVGGFGATSLGVGAGGHLWALGMTRGPGGYDVWSHQGGSAWEAAPGQGAMAIDVAPDGTPWIVDDALNVYRRADGRWQQVPGKGLDVAVGSDGTVWVLDGSEVDPATGAFSLKRWTGNGWERAPQYGATAIAAKDATTVFSVGGDGNVFRLTIDQQVAASATHAPPAGPAGACTSSSDERRVAELMRQHAGQKRASLTCHPILERVARARADDMMRRNYYSHTNPDGVGPNMLVREAGYPLPGWYGTAKEANFIESIMMGSATPEAAFERWLASPGHRRHLLGEIPAYAAQVEYGIGAVNRLPQQSSWWVVLTAERGS